MATSVVSKPVSKNGEKKTPEKKPTTKVTDLKPTSIKSLEEKVERFEKLHGLNTKRERMASTLRDLNKFSYNQDFSPSFVLQDGSDQTFKTSNTDLLEIIVTALKDTLQGRLSTIEEEMISFEF